MYLERVRSKGRTYLYAKKYKPGINDYSNSIIVYRFGRIDFALNKLYRWKNDFRYVPEELKKEGCTMKDIKTWIRTLETGVHKSGRRFSIN